MHEKPYIPWQPSCEDAVAEQLTSCFSTACSGLSQEYSMRWITLHQLLDQGGSSPGFSERNGVNPNEWAARGAAIEAEALGQILPVSGLRTGTQQKANEGNWQCDEPSQ